MHVALHLDAQLPVRLYGGVERVTWDLARALAETGHRVTLLSRAETRCDFAEVVPLMPGRAVAAQLPSGVDVVHFHGPVQAVDVPYLATRHGYGASPPDRQSVFVSRRHAKLHGSHCWVHNGLDWSGYPVPTLGTRGGHFHFLGNAGWSVKNVRGALRITRRAGQKLLVLGGRRLNFRMGFRLSLDRHARFLGLVDDRRKAQVLDASRGLVFPVTWHEPFGLAVIESLYYGCPVFGTPYGALPELVPSDLGVLADTEYELAEALVGWNRFDGEACHRWARERFHARRMAEDYLVLYRRVIAGECLNPFPPALAGEVRNLSWQRG